MGIAKSLRKINYGRDIVQNIREYIDNQSKQRDQSQFNTFMSEAMRNMRHSLSTDLEIGKEKPGADTIKAPNSMQSLMPKYQQPTGSGLVGETGDQKGISVRGFDQVQQKPIEEKKITDDERRMKGDQIMADFMNKVQRLQGIDPGKLDTAIKTIDLYRQGLTPKKKKAVELKSFNQDDDVFSVDEDGNLQLVRPGIKEPGSSKTIGSYVGKDGFHYTKMIGADGKIQEVKSDQPVRPQKSNTIVIKPPKSEKWGDFGAYVNSIDYKQDADGNVVNRNPQERKIAQQFALNQAKSNLLPRALNWYQQEIVTKWGAENISQADLESEIEESYTNGELSPDEAQDLLDFNQYRPFLFDIIRDSYRNNNEE